MNKGGFPKYWHVLSRYFTRISKPSYALHQQVIKSSRQMRFKTISPRSVFSVIFPSVLILKAVTAEEKESKKVSEKNQELIKKADSLYDEVRYDELYDLLLEEQESYEPEILWRLARATYLKHSAFSDQEKIEHLERALQLVTQALELDEDCWGAHKWRAILLDGVWQHKSTKGRIIHSFEVRKHMERATELRPNDAFSYYLLGRWCYEIADLPWYQRKVASVIFATPPESSYEEACFYFEKAEEIDPGFYSLNCLMLGKCLIKMKNLDRGMEYLLRAYNYVVKTPEDAEAHEEAGKVLKQLGMNI